MKSNKTGCPPEREYDLENCVIGAEKAAWFAFIAIGWQRYPLAQVVRADEKLTAFVELQRAIHEFAVSLIV